MYSASERGTSATQQVYETYLAACNERDAGKRHALLTECCTDEATVIYPSGHFTGVAAIAAFLGGLQERFRGVRFTQVSGIEEQHEWFRVAWRMTLPDESVLMEGEDIAERAPAGRIIRVVGFHNPLPPRQSRASPPRTSGCLECHAIWPPTVLEDGQQSIILGTRPAI